MFERNRIDQQDRTSLPVEILLKDGHVLIGRLIVPVVRGLAEELNNAGGFVEFESLEGERAFLPKSNLLSVQSKSLPKAEQLRNRTREDQFDPHSALGVSREAAWDEIRQAYHKLAKTYHPDRFASVELPNEIKDYIAAMARRINMAYDALETARAERQARAEKRAPVAPATFRPGPIGGAKAPPPYAPIWKGSN